MGSEKLISFLESSFLRPLILDKDVTDISYNGTTLFYMNTFKGRMRSNINLSFEDANAFLRQVSNLAEKQFSYQNPLLDVAFGKYRLNAVHHSVCKSFNEPTFSFSIRIASYSNHWMDSPYLSNDIKDLLQVLLDNKCSIAIGGKTSSGKTEFQKYIISLMKANSRLIVIDNVMELDVVKQNENLDVTSWQADERNTYTSIQGLVKNALRNNPDWIIVAESRGEEMLDVLNSAMTGHPIITTLHAQDVYTMPSRMVSMILMNDKKISIENATQDLIEHFHFYIYLASFVNEQKEIIRYISSILYIDREGNNTLLYSSDAINEKYHSFPSDINDVLFKKDDFISLKERWGKHE